MIIKQILQIWKDPRNKHQNTLLNINCSENKITGNVEI